MSRGRLVLIAVALRLLLPGAAWLATLDPGRFMTGDSPTYLALAHSLVDAGRYDDANGPNLNRPPAYPALLACGILLGREIAFAVVAQALLGGAMVAAVFETVRRTSPAPHAPAVAATLAAVDPVSLAWSSSVMAEALLSALVALALLLLVRALDGRGPGAFAGAGLAFAGAAYAKPIAAFVIPIAALGLAVLAPGRPPVRRAACALAFALAGVAALVPWTVRNGLVAGYWSFSSVPDRVLAFAAPASVVAATDGRTFTEVREDWRARLQVPGFETAEGMDALRARGLQRLREAPGTYALIHLRGMARVLLGPGALPLFELFGAPVQAEGVAVGAIVKDAGASAALARLSHLPLLASLLLGALQLLVLVAAAAGLASARGFARPAALLVALVAAVFLVLSGGPWGQSRFRAPMTPALCVLAALGVTGRRA